MGDLCRRRSSAPVRDSAPWLLELIGDMHETMRAANGAGLAVPQIGSCCAWSYWRRRDCASPGRGCRALHGAHQSRSFRCCGRKDEDLGGGLSVPGMRGWCPVIGACAIRGNDEWAVRIDALSRRSRLVAEHEIDHLDGEALSDAIKDLRNSRFNEESFRARTCATTEPRLALFGSALRRSARRDHRSRDRGRRRRPWPSCRCAVRCSRLRRAVLRRPPGCRCGWPATRAGSLSWFGIDIPALQQ